MQKKKKKKEKKPLRSRQKTLKKEDVQTNAVKRQRTPGGNNVARSLWILDLDGHREVDSPTNTPLRCLLALELSSGRRRL